MSNKIPRKFPVLIKKLIVFIKHNKLLGLILLIGAILRLWGIYPGYPFFHSDEGMSYHNAIQMIVNQKFAPDVYAYPLLVVYIHTFFYLVLFIPITFLLSFFSDTTIFDYSSFKSFFEQAIIGWREINVLYWGRYTNAFLGVISVIVTYLVGKKYFNNSIGILAAFFVSVNYRHILASHFALHDIPNSIFLLLTYLYSLNLLKSDKLKDYIKAGIMAGLLLSTKYSPLGVIPPLVAHLFKISSSRYKKNWLLLGMSIIILSSFLTFFVLNIYYFFNISEWYKYIEYLQVKYNTGKVIFLPFPYVYIFKFGLNPILSILAILGIVIAIYKDFKKASILLAPIVLFFLGLTVLSSGGTYVRNFTLVIPVLLIFAAYLVHFLYIKLSKRFLTRFLVIFTLVGLSTASHLYNSILLDSSYAKPWNLSNAKYDLSNLKGKKIAGDNWFWDQIFDEGKNTKVDFNIDSNFTYSELQEKGVEYVLVDTGSIERFFTWWMAINNSVKFINPVDLMYETFAGGVLRELISLRTQEFAKPWQAYESNIFLIPILPKKENFSGEKIYADDFEKNLTWEIDGARGYPVRLIKHIDDRNKCIGNRCAYIGPILKNSNEYSSLGSVSMISPIIEIESNKLYRVKMKIRSDIELTPKNRDGFFKVELYKERDDYRVYTPNNVIFISSRVNNKTTDWEEKDVFVDVPEGYNFMAIKLQTFRNTEWGFYFDEVLVEKSASEDYQARSRKPFPQDAVFINSII